METLLYFGLAPTSEEKKRLYKREILFSEDKYNVVYEVLAISIFLKSSDIQAEVSFHAISLPNVIIIAF